MICRCAPALIQVGFFETAATLVVQARAHNIKVKDEVKWVANDLKKKVDRIRALLDVTKEHVVAPAMQWAQSSEWLLLDVKFAHRLDAPGCVDARFLKVNITESSLTLSASCLISEEQVKFQLSFDFFAPVDSEKSGYKHSAGHVTINVRKKEQAQWKLPMKGKKPNNLKVWYEMSEKTQGEMEKFLEEKKKKTTDL